MANLNGLLILRKDAGMTSMDVVNRVRRLYGTRQVGHTGTLDPMATGVLVMLIGRAAKFAEFAQAENKEYIAGMKLGVISDTGDVTGVCTETGLPLPPEVKVLRVCGDFRGELMQVPPMVSALKVDGRKLVDLARKGVTVERAARPVTISRLDARRLAEDEYELDCAVSKGTYIRVLCEDIGRALGCGACMSSLLRTATGSFRLEDSHSLAELAEMTQEQREGLLRPVESLFTSLSAVELPSFFEKLARSGCEIYLKKIGVSLPVGQRVRLCGEGRFFALGEVRAYPDGDAVKPIKQLDAPENG